MADAPFRLPSASPPAPSGNGYYYGANYPQRDPLAPHGIYQPRPQRPTPLPVLRKQISRQPRTGFHRCPDGTRVYARAQYLPSLPGANPNDPTVAGRGDGVTVYRISRADHEPVDVLNVVGDQRAHEPDWTHIDARHQKGEAA